MASTPNRVSPDSKFSDSLALINDNADKSVQDSGDLGAKFSTSASYSVTLAAGTQNSQPVGVTDSKAAYVAGRMQIVPRVDVFVDNDLNYLYLLAGYVGSSLSAGQANAMVSVSVARSASSGTAATFLVQIRNFDAAGHTYYVYVDESYMSSPPTGYFR